MDRRAVGSVGRSGAVGGTTARVPSGVADADDRAGATGATFARVGGGAAIRAGVGTAGRDVGAVGRSVSEWAGAGDSNDGVNGGVSLPRISLGIPEGAVGARDADSAVA